MTLLSFRRQFERHGIRPTNYFTRWPYVLIGLCLAAWLLIYAGYKVLGF